MEKRKNYTMVLKRPVLFKSEDCKQFGQYLKNKISGARKLLKFESSTNKDNCIYDIEMECWTTGGTSPKKFKDHLMITYPDVEIIELRKVVA